MVWVCPPHTSMNLYSSSPARSVIDFTRARAAAGSRNSSTNFISVLVSDDRGGGEGVKFVVVGLTHLLDRVEGEVGFALIDLGHREPDVDEHPVAVDHVLLGKQLDADDSLDAIDLDLREVRVGVDNLDHLSGNPEAHVVHSLVVRQQIRG